MKVKKILIKYGIAVIIFCAVFIAISAIKVSAGTENTTGWLWGGSDAADNSTCHAYPFAPAGCINDDETGVGWISMNNANPEIVPPGSVSYGVNIPASGLVSGYAWSKNIGYIDFAPQDHCTTGTADSTHYKAASCTNSDGNTGGVTRNATLLTGWARIVGIAQETANSNSGGWSGWIKLNGTAQDGSTYGVTVAYDGTISGYGWSDELGWINFSRSETGISICPLSYSNYNCTKNVLDCSNVSNCGMTNNSLCTAKNSCTGNTDSITLPNSGCDYDGSCAPTTTTCPACSSGNSIGGWIETAP